MKNVKAVIMVAIWLGLVLGVTNANAQDAAHSNNASQTSSSDSNILSSTGSERQFDKFQYAEECKKYKIDCAITYGSVEVKDEEKNAQSQSSNKDVGHSDNSSEPFLNGTFAIVIVVLLFVGAILLWLWFGGAGVLLSSSPKEIKAQHEVPENWGKSNIATAHSSNDILSAILALEDRRIAMIELLRMCLLHGAKISATRLARSDTERTVFRRLPEILPQREDLAFLLRATELVHYGGQEITADQFDLLISKARNFLSIRKMANA